METSSLSLSEIPRLFFRPAAGNFQDKIKKLIKRFQRFGRIGRLGQRVRKLFNKHGSQAQLFLVGRDRSSFRRSGS